jgi:hypothetical protein
VFRLACKRAAQYRVLRRHPDRAGVEVALAHHDAALDHQRRGGEAELVGAEQRPMTDVAAGLHLAVGLDADAARQAVQHQRSAASRQAELPWRPGVLDAAPRRAPVPPSCPAMTDVVGLALATPAAMVPTPDLDTSFTLTEAARLAFFRSWMSWARSSIE